MFGLVVASCNTDTPQTPTLSTFEIDTTDAPFYYAQSDSGFTLTATFMNSQCSAFDLDLSGNDAISICASNQPLAMALSETYTGFTFGIPNVEIAVVNYIDTLCTYSDTLSDSVIYTYKVNYSPDSTYPTGYSLQINNQLFVQPHSYGETIDPANLNFTYLNTGIELTYSKNGSVIFPTPGLTITSYTNYKLGPWLNAGKKYVVFKFTSNAGHLYYGWIELKILNEGSVHVYSAYCHQLS